MLTRPPTTTLAQTHSSTTQYLLMLACSLAAMGAILVLLISFGAGHLMAHVLRAAPTKLTVTDVAVTAFNYPALSALDLLGIVAWLGVLIGVLLLGLSVIYFAYWMRESRRTTRSY